MCRSGASTARQSPARWADARHAARGTRIVASYDEDTTSMGVAAGSPRTWADSPGECVSFVSIVGAEKG